ncbi:MAG: peptidyl-prolyl cis-trans isomerase [Blastopirellula sp. JB062]
MIRRRSISIFLLTLVTATLGNLLWCAVTAHAQERSLRSWLPWSSSSSEEAPVDPFKNRGGSGPTSTYRVAAAPSTNVSPKPGASSPLPYPSNPYATPGYAQQPSNRAVTTQIGDEPNGQPMRAPAPPSGYANSTTQPWRPQAAPNAASWGSPSTNRPPTPSTNRWSTNAEASRRAPAPTYGVASGGRTHNASPITQPHAATVVKDDELFTPARIIALVGGQPILAGDILGPVNQALEKRIAELSDEQRATVTEEVLEEQRQMALRELLPGLIDTKMVYLDFIRAIPPDRLSEMQQHLEAQYAEYQMDADLESYGVNTPAELDIKLRAEGSSLEKKKRLFLEQIVAQQQLRMHVKPDTEVTHQQMLDFYHEHIKEYEQPSRARWEQLMVRFDKFSSKAEAERAIADLGNQVLRGAPLDAVAKKHSHCFRAEEGGKYDWTTQNSLKNETIDAAIFSLPPNRLSQIIESPEGYHIVRVLERDEATVKPFREAQVEIKEKIKRQRANQQQQEYLADVKRRTQVWTIFDEEKSAQTASSDSSEARR